jgi:TRAP-type C4-dicarboxylate transport system substrate-binding protein
MPAADQKILTDIWVEANKESGKGSMVNIEKGKAGIQGAGKKVTTPTASEIAAWEKAADVAIQSWKNDCKALSISDEVVAKVLAKWKEVRSKHIVNVK